MIILIYVLLRITYIPSVKFKERENASTQSEMFTIFVIISFTSSKYFNVPAYVYNNNGYFYVK